MLTIVFRYVSPNQSKHYKGEKNNGFPWVVNKVYESRKSWLVWYMFCEGHAQYYMNINI